MDDLHLTQVTTSGTQVTTSGPNFTASGAKYEQAIRSAFVDAMASKGKLAEEIYKVYGYAGKKIRLFLNNLIEIVEDAKYLEIGVFAGATFIPACYQNKVTAVGIDDWTWPGSNRSLFFQYLSTMTSETSRISLMDFDFRKVPYDRLGMFNVVFYDASHEEQDQYDGVKLPQPCLADEHILIIDDWNMPQVRKGTLEAIKDLGLNVDFALEIRTTMNDLMPACNGPESDWHNGFYIASVRKNRNIDQIET